MQQLKEHILFEDEHLLVFNKPSGLASQSDKTGDESVLDLLAKLYKKEFGLVHRLDRPVSGLMLFAKTTKALSACNKALQDKTIHKRYLAVVKNKPSKPSDTLTHFLRKDQKQNRSFAFDKPLHHTKEAILEYRFIKSIERYHLLEINVQTGRHHQIRAQLAAIQNPIKGDVKYGFKRSNKDRSIHLHAYLLSFQHPITQKQVSIKAPIPTENVWQAFEIDLTKSLLE